MLSQKIIQVFRQYRGIPLRARQAYLNNFTEKMMYRTTKTENPEVTPKMVHDILRKHK